MVTTQKMGRRAATSHRIDWRNKASEKKLTLQKWLRVVKVDRDVTIFCVLFARWQNSFRAMEAEEEVVGESEREKTVRRT